MNPRNVMHDQPMSSGEDPQTLLEVSNLTIGYEIDDETVTLVNDVSFNVLEKEVFCIVGESGSGKSLTALAVLGLLPAPLKVLKGTVKYRGVDLLSLSARQMQKLLGNELALVSQDPMTALNPVKRVGKQLERSLRLHSKLDQIGRRERVVELLNQVGVTDASRRARAFPHQWSGGMRQRALIASAIANSPSLLIADEPTTALDVTVQAQLMDVLSDARQASNAALILITHDLGLVAQQADRVMVMYGGRVMELSPVRELFAQPRQPYTQGLLKSLLSADDSFDRKRAYAIPGNPVSPRNRPAGCPFAPRCEYPGKRAECFSTQQPLREIPVGREFACEPTYEALVRSAEVEQ